MGCRKRFTVAIPTLNRRGMLQKALESVFGLDYPGGMYEVLVIDDGCTDDTPAYLKSLEAPGRDLRIITHGRNMGIPSARNSAVRNANGEILAFIDDDCIVEKNWLAVMDRAHRSNPGAMAVGTALENANPGNLMARYLFNAEIYLINNFYMPEGIRVGEIMRSFRPPEAGAETRGCGAHWSFKREVFDEIGPYDEKLDYGGDLDFHIRLRDRYGESGMVFAPETRVIHHYRTRYLDAMRKFFNDGRGGIRFRRYRSSRWAGKSSLDAKVHALNYAIAISLYTGENTAQKAAVFLVAASATASTLLGEACQNLSEAISPKAG
jgi:glycosyltransferase involved in cell wall biosynthesis